MILELLDRHNRKKEIRRLEKIKADFLDEYKAICTKYRAQLIPRILPLSDDTFRVIQQLDIFDPDAIKQMAEKVKNDQKNPQPK